MKWPSTRDFLELGKPQWNSEKHIKKAYYKIAKETHPDMFQDADKKAAATEAFRELHAMYEEQLHRYMRGHTAPTDAAWDEDYDSDRNAYRSGTNARKSDGYIRRHFEDIVNELKKERDERHYKKDKQTIDDMRRLWPRKKEQCWQTAKDWFLKSEIRDLSVRLQESDPELSDFLRSREAEESAALRSYMREMEDDRVEIINKSWSLAVASELESWANKEWDILDYSPIAARVENPDAAEAILAWKDRRKALFSQERQALYQTIADGIVECNVESTQTRALLSKLLIFEYEEIYELLPCDVAKRLKFEMRKLSQEK